MCFIVHFSFFPEKFEKLEDDADHSTTDVNFPSGEISHDCCIKRVHSFSDANIFLI